jgi:hypothetical protein
LAANIYLADVDDKGHRTLTFDKVRRCAEPPPLDWYIYKRADEKLDIIFERDGEEV